MTSIGAGSNFFKAYLSSSLAQGGSETTVYLSTIQNLLGETIVSADFALFGRGTITIDPLSSTGVESATFTGVDATNVALTGVTRNLSGVSNSVLTSASRYHPVGTLVIISFGVHNLSDIVDYIANAVSGISGTGSDTVAGSIKISEGMGTNPRAMSALVSEQTIPDMTLKVLPFAISSLDKDIVSAGGDTGTFTAPTTNPRIDLVVYDTVNSVIAIRAGTEGASPSKPTPTFGDIVLASVYLKTTSTVITERTTGNNAYITRWYSPAAYGTLTTSAGVADAGKIPALNSAGKLDPTLTVLQPTIQVFTASGTWTKPTGCKKIVVELVGGGGNGGNGSGSSGSAASGGGGGGGGYARKTIDVTAVSSVSLTIGAATASSSFGAYLSATGGGSASGLLAGTGGVGSDGDVNITGQGGGAGSGGVAIFGGSPGGSSMLGGGGAGGSGSGSYGGGGGGGTGVLNGGVTVGGTGGAGLCLVTEFY